MKHWIGRVPLNPYGAVVYVYTDKTAFIKTRGIDEEHFKHACGITDCNEERNQFHVLIADNCLDTLAHECAHVVFILLRNKGVILSTKSEEAYTYLMGYIVSEVHNVIWRHEKKQAKNKATSDATTEAASGAEGEGIKQGSETL